MRNKIIISAEQAGLPEEYNLMATNELASILEYLPKQEGIACYKGNKETIFAVLCCDNFTLARAEEVAKQFNQESILFVDSGGCACLLYVDGSAKYDVLGKFKQTSKEYAESSGGNGNSYTMIGGKYYVAD